MALPAQLPSLRRLRISMPATTPALDMTSTDGAVGGAALGAMDSNGAARNRSSIPPLAAAATATMANVTTAATTRADTNIYTQGLATEPPVPELDNDMSLTTTDDDLASSVSLASPSAASLAEIDDFDPTLVPMEEHAHRQDDAVSMYHSLVENQPMVLSHIEVESGSDGYGDEDDESTV